MGNGNDLNLDNLITINKTLQKDFKISEARAYQLWGEFRLRFPHYAQQAEDDPALVTYTYAYLGELLLSLDIKDQFSALTAKGIDEFIDSLPLETLE